MALTFFWRCESENLDPDHDFTAGTDTTGTAATGVVINGTAALVGSNGIHVTASGMHYRFDSELATCNRLTGSVGFAFRAQTWANNTNFLSLAGSVYTRSYAVRMIGADTDGSRNLRIRINEDGTGASAYDSTGGQVLLNTNYFATISWDQPNNLRRIRIYNLSSGGAPLDESISTDAYTAPEDLVGADGMRFGESSGFAGTFYLDNVFVGNAYDDADTFVTKRLITSYTEYAGSAPTAGPPFSVRRLKGMIYT